MKLAIGADHAGVELKKSLADYLGHQGHQIIDVGTYTTEPVDYPDYAEKVGRAVLGGEAERGILICGSGVGASVAANKLPGIRAGLCHDVYSAHQGVEHDTQVLRRPDDRGRRSRQLRPRVRRVADFVGVVHGGIRDRRDLHQLDRGRPVLAGVHHGRARPAHAPDRVHGRDDDRRRSESRRWQC